MAQTPIRKDDLRDRLDILDVVGQYVRLQKAGTEYRGRCPFHDEKTASFYVNAEKGLWVCRGACGVGGDVFDFVMRAEKLDFRDAAELLANKLGCTLEVDQRQQRRADERERVLTICKLAAGLFERALWHGEGGAVARDYLTARGLGDAIIRQFRLGYAPPGWDALTRYLTRHDVSLADAELAGLVKRRQRGDGYYDTFRGRVMFPILDAQGRVIAFGGRVLDPHDEPKYLNSPESVVFSKGRLLYGLPFATDALRDGGVVVEGYMDVIALHEHGVTNAVATLGTALTPEHLKLLRRHTDQVTLCYDGDTAGMRATDRAAVAFIQEGMRGRVLSLPTGKDPDEYVREHGQAAFQELVTSAPELIEYRLRAALADVGDDAEARSVAVREVVVAILGDISDEVRQAQYVRRVAEWWAGEAVGLQEELERTLIRALNHRRRPTQTGGARGGAVAGETISRAEQVERRWVQYLLSQPRDRDRERLLAAVPPADLTDPVCRELAEQIVALGATAGWDSVGAAATEAGRRLLADLACSTADDVNPTRLLAELECLKLEGAAEALRRRRDTLSGDDFAAQTELYRALSALERRLDEQRRALASDGGMR